MSYCLLADVQALNASRTTYGTGTKPTAVQVQGFIDQVAGEIDTILARRYVLTPVTLPASFVAYLQRLNALGGAYQAESAMFPEAPSASPGSSPQGIRYYNQYMVGLASLKDGSAIDPAAAVSGSDPLARTYLTDNPDNDPNEDGSTDGQQPAFASSGSRLREF